MSKEILRKSIESLKRVKSTVGCVINAIDDSSMIGADIDTNKENIIGFQAHKKGCSMSKPLKRVRFENVTPGSMFGFAVDDITVVKCTECRRKHIDVKKIYP